MKEYAVFFFSFFIFVSPKISMEAQIIFSSTLNSMTCVLKCLSCDSYVDQLLFYLFCALSAELPILTSLVLLHFTSYKQYAH